MSSADLFKDNKITMVNVWGTWCHNCVGEMEELAEIHTRLQAKGCGVVGVEYEQKPIDTMADEVRAFLEEKGVSYPNVIIPEDNEILSRVSGFPTTFFVDSEGTILTYPISGAMVEAYEPTVDQLLAGEAVDTVAGAGAISNDSGEYRVILYDMDGNPVARSSSSATRPPAPSSPPTPTASPRSAWRSRRSMTSMPASSPISGWRSLNPSTTVPRWWSICTT